MIWNRQRRSCTVTMTKTKVASSLAYNFVADSCEGSSCFATRKARDETHTRILRDRNAAMDLKIGIWNRFAVSRHILDAECNRLARVRESLIYRLALAVAAGKCRHDYHVPTLGIRLKDDMVTSVAHVKLKSISLRADAPRATFEPPHPRHSDLSEL